MDGVLIIDKPAGMTSHDVVNRVRRVLKTKRVGHTGTLDPFATGVLVLLVGKATRLAQFVDKDEKEYDATVRFGFETDTGDRTGVPTTQVETLKPSLVADLERVLPQFRGRIKQTPPMYSAKKVAGKRLYELARKGIEIEIKPIVVDISELELLPVPPAREVPAAASPSGMPSAGGSASTIGRVKLRIRCSAGTYIRSLAQDIGRATGAGGHLEELRRTRAGKFTIGQAASLDELEKADAPHSFILPLSEAVSNLEQIVLGADRIEKTMNGMSTRVDRDDLIDNRSVAMFSPDGNLIAVGIYDTAESCIKPKIVLG